MRCVWRIPAGAGARWFYREREERWRPTWVGLREEEEEEEEEAGSGLRQAQRRSWSRSCSPLRRLLDGCDRKMGRSDGCTLVTSHVSVSRVIAAQKLSEVLLGVLMCKCCTIKLRRWFVVFSVTYTNLWESKGRASPRWNQYDSRLRQRL
jgi:hypothetical protein